MLVLMQFDKLSNLHDISQCIIRPVWYSQIIKNTELLELSDMHRPWNSTCLISFFNFKLKIPMLIKGGKIITLFTPVTDFFYWNKPLSINLTGNFIKMNCFHSNLGKHHISAHKNVKQYAN